MYLDFLYTFFPSFQYLRLQAEDDFALAYLNLISMHDISHRGASELWRLIASRSDVIYRMAEDGKMMTYQTHRKLARQYLPPITFEVKTRDVASGEVFVYVSDSIIKNLQPGHVKLCETGYIKVCRSMLYLYCI